MAFLRVFRGFVGRLRQDWRADRHACLAALLLVLTGIVEVAFYVNFPQPTLTPDTPAYLRVVDTILTRPYLTVNIWRLPGYPLFVSFVYLFAGRGNLEAVSIVQGVLFALATLECYILAVLLFKRAWIAFIIALLIGTNVIFIGYVKPIMSEGLALWALVTLALALVWFIRTTRARAFWWMMACLLLLILTRPEWVYLPALLFAYLLLVVWRREGFRFWLRRLLVGLALVYVVVLAYMSVNNWTNRYFVLTAVANYNLLGKVLQYNMQDEAPAQYAAVSQQVDAVIAQVDRDPYHILPYLPSLERNAAAPAGAFAQSIILHHPFEFVVKSVPLIFSSLTYYVPGADSHMTAPLAWLTSLDQWLYAWNILFPVCAALWLGLLCWRRARKQRLVLEMGILTLLGLYGLVVTTMGGYTFPDYVRFHIVFDPLLTVIIFGSLFLGAAHAARWLAGRFGKSRSIEVAPATEAGD
jgi:hypothetical protein